MNILRYYISILLCLVGICNAHSQLSFSSKQFDFKQVEWHSQAQGKVIIVNKGKTPITITDIRSSNSAITAKWPSTPIAPKAKVEVELTLNAEIVGTFSRTLSLYTEGSTDIVDQMNLIGEVPMPNYKSKSVSSVNEADYPYHVGDICLSNDYAEFDEVQKGKYSQQEILVYNKGKSTYLPELMHLPKYISALAVPERLHAGRTGKIILTLDGNQLEEMGLTQTNIYLSRFPGDNVCKENEIAVSAVMVPAYDSISAAQQQFGPQLNLSSTTVRMPAFNSKGQTKGKITLKNTGKAPLEISNVQVFNPGLSMSYVKKIAPGASAKLSVTVQRDLMKTSHNPLRILMITNDSQHSKVFFDVAVGK